MAGKAGDEVIAEFFGNDVFDLPADFRKTGTERSDQGIDEALVETRRFHFDDFPKELQSLGELFPTIPEHIGHAETA